MITRKMLLLNGPNLDMLGVREPDVYGSDTLATLEQTVRMHAEQHGVELACYQSNNEGKLIDKIHGAQGKYDGIVYNPGAHTHYSYALRDAVASIDVPVVEVHLSDVDAREAFRSVSVIAPACVAQVKGMGVGGYCRAIDILLESPDLPRLGEGYDDLFGSGENERVASGRAECAPTGVAGACADDGDGDAAVGVAASDGAAALDGAASGVAAALDGASADGAVADGDVTDVAAADGAAADASDTFPVDATGAFPVDTSTMGAVSARRLGIVRAACRQLGLGALLVRDTSNIHWISGFDGVFDGERAHALLVTDNFASLHTDSRYSNALYEAAVRQASGIAIDETRVNHFQFAHQALAPGVDGEFAGQLGIEDSITYAEFIKAVGAFGTAHLAPTNDVVETLRSVKDATELQRMRAAQAITDAAFSHIVSYMRPGMTEREVQLELEDYMLRHGADGLAFSSIVACGEHGADPHAVPSGKRLEAGQCVVLDFGARAFGYCSDMTRVVFLGQPDDEMARAWEVLRQANETVEEALRPGMTGAEAHNLAERVLADGGFAGTMGHGLGHGVGLDCHELPVLNARNDAPLVAGNVVTVEPGIYLPGRFGMRLEDCGVITAEGYEAFSQLGHEMVVL